jgi:nicotinamide mononucleotide transporter
MSYWQQILLQIKATSAIEWVGISFGLLQVLLAVKNTIWNFVAGIISTIAFCIFFYNAALYAESSLNFYYIIISLLGIIYWKKNSINTSQISFTSKQQYIWTIVIAVVSFIISYMVLIKFTNSTVPIWDSAAAALAWAGSWLLAKRKAENWIVLNLSNALAIPLQLYKGYTMVACFTFILFTIAIVGYIQWYKLAKAKY